MSSWHKTEPKLSVIFDLGGVVLRWNPDEIARKFCLDEAKRSLIKREVFKHPDWLEMDRGVLQEHEAIHRFHRRTGLSLAEVSALMQAVKDSLLPIPETVELLEELADQEVPLYCLSNMSATTANYLRARYSFWRVFRGVVISGEIQLIKPDPAIFEHIVERFRLTPGNTVFIDDHRPNIDSAGGLGFKPLLFNDPFQCRNTLEKLFANPQN
jgi:putative hydrolase of the HAD superfamily